uniref:Uncharacterized protein n=1 Tax=Chromera velia CCMP2878 TaxID=1169474 RepID=A0A0G4I814_9ALVE|eukprot:Cvel_11737.t1-p1 / transcript=Cvel_11737.t1 / gene=Cvel_11737 / organism=Chromera_velia_CCMP2878 / gene_product=hypothetical protein / transcript_product=hypothetical protein / location=Cvel_scaffold745:61658-63837(-) / protein_length=188 / sequence_SO=supercontig / SO=protein_coding / is_pseudo=false
MCTYNAAGPYGTTCKGKSPGDECMTMHMPHAKIKGTCTGAKGPHHPWKSVVTCDCDTYIPECGEDPNSPACQERVWPKEEEKTKTKTTTPEEDEIIPVIPDKEHEPKSPKAIGVEKCFISGQTCQDKAPGENCMTTNNPHAKIGGTCRGERGPHWPWKEVVSCYCSSFVPECGEDPSSEACQSQVWFN